MTVGFIRLRDVSDGRFLFGYEISMTVGFAGLLSRNNGWIYLVMKSQ